MEGYWSVVLLYCPWLGFGIWVIIGHIEWVMKYNFIYFLCTIVYNSFIYNVPNLEITKISFNRKMKKHTQVHIYCCCCLVAKSCPALFDPMDYSSPGSSVHGISQKRILEWIAVSFSRGSSWPRDVTCISCIGRQILYSWTTRESPVHIYNRILFT